MLACVVATYKRDIGIKKRDGIMSNKEGKSKFSLHGYITLCKHSMKVPQSESWFEGLFAALFMKV